MSNLFRHFLSDECGATAIGVWTYRGWHRGRNHRRSERSGHEPEHDIQQHLVATKIAATQHEERPSA